MKFVLPALVAVLVLSGCSTLDTGDKGPSAVDAKKPKPVVKATFMSYRDMQDFAERHPEVNDQLLAIAPAMAYRPGQSKADVGLVVADIAGLAAQEIVDWIGTALAAEAKKHTAQFASFVQDPDWWTDGAPDVAAIELTRVAGADTLFQAIVIIRPVFPSKSNHGNPRAFQLVPIYVLETKPAAKDFGSTMGAVISLTLETSWMGDKGVPGNAVLGTYCFTLKEYTVGKPVLLSLKADDSPTDDKKKDSVIKLADASHYFALPETPATLSATFAVAETDPSKWVGLMEQVATAITGQASNANAAVKAKL